MMGLLGLTTLMACSTDDRAESQPEEPGLPVELSASAQPYEDETLVLDGTRSWTPPTGYYLYDDLYDEGVNYESLTNKSIDVYLCPRDAEKPTTPQHARLRYSPSATSTAKWKLSIKDVKDPDKITTDYGYNYYAYGFIPRDVADNASIDKLSESSSYADGAVLTIEGLQSVAADASVIIGAKTGPNDENDGGLRRGEFGITLNSGTDGKTYIYLLFDHLCPALRVSMRVDNDYSSLRTIKLKRLYLQTANDDGPTTKKANVTVTLKSNDGTSDPIESIKYTAVGTEVSGGTLFSSSEGVALPNVDSGIYSVFVNHFIPYNVTKLILTSTYDVYDKNVTTEHPNGNLVRKNCEATNTFDLKKLVYPFDGIHREYRYNLSLLVTPTFLYMLSDPDLNNPKLELESLEP